MKASAIVFLAAFLVLVSSWAGLVLTPQLQLGGVTQTNILGSSDLYPVMRPGMARQGLEVYRANGCMYCHSQQVSQDATHCEIILTDPGTNAVATLAALGSLNTELAKPATLADLPKTILTVADMNAADPVLKTLHGAGAQVEVHVVPQGPDIARGWGRRRTVAQDYLYDDPVQLGVRRIGPDLANEGNFKPDAGWQYRHLYAPASETPGSQMPPYRFLFETRKIVREPSPDALKLSGDLAPAAGYEVVPKPEARALVAYLMSLRADAPLFEAPVTSLAASTSAPDTNAPAATSSSK